MIKLSIIIPYYNTPEYTSELLNLLDQQLTDEVEVFLIDDGSTNKDFKSFPWIK